MIYRKPFTDAKNKLHSSIVSYIEETEFRILDELPESREKQMVIDKLDEAILWVGAAITVSDIKDTDENTN